MPKILLTPEEAAFALGIGRTKVYQLLRNGTVSSVLIGGSRRIPTAALIGLVADLEHREIHPPPLTDDGATLVPSPADDWRKSPRPTDPESSSGTLLRPRRAHSRSGSNS